MDSQNKWFRKFRTEDAETVSNLIRDNLLQAYSKDYPEEIIKDAYEKFTSRFVLSMSNKRKMYVAVDDGRVVGTAGIDFDTISDVFVDVQYHSKGYDKKLIALLEEIASNNGFQLVKLIGTVTVQKRYEKLGYHTVGEIESQVFGKEILMEKYLI